VISPDKPFTARVTLPPDARPDELTLLLRSADGEVELSYRPGAGVSGPVPEPALPALPPPQIRSPEELYLTGLHLEQYRHATFRPEDYYEEALRRDPDDSRCNCALGVLLLRRGSFSESEAFLRRAVARLTGHNANPRDGEPFLYLAYVLELQARYGEAEKLYFKATWNAAVKAPALHGLARLNLRWGIHEHARAFAEEALSANPRDHSVRVLKIAALRKLGRTDEAVSESRILLRDDPLSPAGLNERLLLGCQAPGEETLRQRVLAPGGTNAIELALEYLAAGCDEEVRALLSVEGLGNGPAPLACYIRAAVAERAGQHDEAVAHVRRAEELPAGTCFPNRIELIPVLELAGKLFPEGARSSYHLGNLLYDKRQVPRAISAWEISASRGPGFPTVHRNLALAAFNKLGDHDRARWELECAFALDPSDPRLLFELDQLSKRMGLDPAKRIRLLEGHLPLVLRRDDCTLELISLLTLQGEYGRAHDLLLGRRFHPWEGGEGKVTRQYVVSLLGLSKRALIMGNAESAAESAQAALVFPENLGEGRLAGALDSDIQYALGCALEKAASPDPAGKAFERAAAGQVEPSLSMSYNDQPADMLFFQGLALARLDRADEASARYGRLIDYAERNRDAVIAIDYFAVSLPDFLIFDDDPTRRNRIFCTYLEGLGRLGLSLLAENHGEDWGRATDLLKRVLREEPSHGGAREILRDLEGGWEF